jgi:hypothetical protein
MVGAFGLLDGWHPSRFPSDRLAENQPRLDATMLNKIGGLVEGAVTELRTGDRGYRLEARAPNILIDGNRVLVVRTDWALPWFACPQCGRRCRHVYLLDPIAWPEVPPPRLRTCTGRHPPCVV